MRAKNYLLLLIVTFLAFASCLANGFVGDSMAMFGKNSFYKKPANLQKVFSKELIMGPESFLPREVEEASHSGFISYRPVTALTFFADSFLYKDHPAGYHLTDILLHLFTVILVFLIAGRLCASPGTALLAALLFGTHPIQSEVVSSIGYRSDLLAALFILGGLLSFGSAAAPGSKRRRWLTLSYGCFFLALFSKETALAFFPLLILMDLFFLKPRPESAARHLRGRAAAYAGYAAILVFYLWIYFVVCPSDHYPAYSIFKMEGREQGVVALKILYDYFKVFVLPFTVTVLPPLYTPAAFPVNLLALGLTVLAVALSLVLAWRSWRTNKLITFAVAWFYLTYLPASNIILLPNPVAFRFMYLPSVGVFVLMALGLSRLTAVLKQRFPTVRLAGLLPAAAVGLCLSASVGNNGFFKNDLAACREMIRNYPDASRPYWNLGLTLFDKKDFAGAAEAFDIYRRIDPRNPFVINPEQNPMFLYTRGRCAVENPDEAIAYFQAALRLKPDYTSVWRDLAKAYLLKQDYAFAGKAARNAIRYDTKTPLAYVYAAHSAVELGDFSGAAQFIKEAEALAPDDENVRYVSALLRERTQALAAPAP